MATNGSINGEQYAATSQASETGSANAGNKDLAKDEVGWYFVEQYYTTLSKSPEKLHLFYSKKSQFVYGDEAEVVPIAQGRSDIQQRIKDLDFQDCKVRISNVDSQGSEDNIVIQVIGETSNKGGDPKKFVQTFILARQPSGYFVLNDILRYINEDIEEEVEETADKTPAVTGEAAVPVAEAEAEQEAPAAEEPTPEAEPVELDAVVVDEKLEEAVAETPAPVEETPAPEPAAEVPETSTKEKTESVPDAEKVIEEVAEEETKKVEEPKDPNPTPAAAPTPAPAPVAAEPEKPKGPPKPMTWASRAAAAAGPARAAVPIPKTATPPASTQTRAPVPAATQPTPAPAASQSSDSTTTTAAAKEQASEWQTAETKRQNRPQSISAAPVEKEGPMAYIKFVTEKVKEDDLKNTLTTFGELAYFDINRQKNCAFVEFKNQAGYAAAVAANPHTVNGENIIVEQRRPKANAYGGSNYNATRGGTAGRGRGGFETNRGGNQGTGRGGFPGQTRGGRGGAPRGRGAAQAGPA